MKNLFRSTIIGLILLSSLPAFSETNYPAPAGDQPAAPAPDLSKAIGQKSNADKTASPPGGGYYDDGELVKDVESHWPLVLNSSCKYNRTDSGKMYNQALAAAKKFSEAQKSCNKREDVANSYCMESRSEGIKDLISASQVVMAGVSGMMEACSAFGKVMDMGNKALTTYQTACSSARGFCNSSCKDAVTSVETIKTKRNEIVKEVAEEANKRAAIADQEKNASEATVCRQLAGSVKKILEMNSAVLERELVADGQNYKAVNQKLKTCEGYQKELATAGLGVISMIKSFGTANNCEKQTSNAAVTTPTPVDCTIPANKQNVMECICADAPRTPGCNNGLDTGTVAKSADSLRAAGGAGEYNPSAGSGVNGGIDGGSNSPDLAGKAGDGGGSAPGAPMGGGSGLGGGSGGFGGGPGGGAAQKAAGLNTNILGGEGGGGGGGSWGGYGSDGDGALRQYLPGGKRDPSAAMAAGAAVSKEVTSQGGKSNWEKVRDRYRDNKPSLLGY